MESNAVVGHVAKFPLTEYDSLKEKDAKKLRSRHAAQSRRILENMEFDSLAAVLPIPRVISSNLLDKASVIRLATSYLKLHRFCIDGFPTWQSDLQTVYDQFHDFDSHLGSRILEALDGFLFCLAEDGTILYVSETVSIGLGLSQIELIGNRISDYIHNEDLPLWCQFFAAFHTASDWLSRTPQKLISRLKSSLVKRATKDTSETSLGFKVVEFYVAPRFARKTDEISGARETVLLGYCGYALPLLCLSMPECRLDRNAFVITTLLDLRIHYVDSRAEEILLDGKVVPVKGLSVYSFIHASDLAVVNAFHQEVLKLGASNSGLFRLLCAKGGCTLVQAYGVRVNRVRARQNQCSIIAVLCYAIGSDDWREEIMSESQLRHMCDTGWSPEYRETQYSFQ